MRNEISSLRHGIHLNGYPRSFIDSVLNSKGGSRPSSVYATYVNDISEKFKRTEYYLVISLRLSLVLGASLAVVK
jgi:hypothetical protein